MKAIIVAAGSAKRLGEKTKNLPKSLLNINGKTILEKQTSLLKHMGINEIIVITGPNSNQFNKFQFEFINDKNFDNHDILGSLMVTRDFFIDDLMIFYSDILFDEKILSQIINFKCDIGIAIDLDWKKHYKNRTEHPESEAENVLLNNDNIIQIKKNITKIDDNQIGEFLGIIKLSNKGAKIFVKQYDYLEKNHIGQFCEAPSLDKAYITDMIQNLIDSNFDVKPILVKGNWCEIDTKQDLENALKIF
jgi:L-glutamine-phosphate cytidylyltransferase